MFFLTIVLLVLCQSEIISVKISESNNENLNS